jgi:hypothetical protein
VAYQGNGLRRLQNGFFVAVLDGWSGIFAFFPKISQKKEKKD